VRTKVKNRVKNLLTVNVEGKNSLYIKPREIASLTEKELNSPHVQALIREKYLEVVTEEIIPVKEKVAFDARVTAKGMKGKKPKGGDG
jgi:hypothetical protein